MRPVNRHSVGMTLLEVILTLVIAAILGTMIHAVMGESLNRGNVPMTQIHDTLALHSTLERARTDFNAGLKWQPSNTYGTDTRVFPTSGGTAAYRCTTAGVSDSTEPTWPAAGSVTDGSVTWERVAGATPVIEAFKANVEAKSYGTGYSVSADYIKFEKDPAPPPGVDLWNEAPISPTNDILKVTLTDDTGEALTALFVAE